jgi:hypothetical protein
LDPVTAGLTALNAVIDIINAIKAQDGLTDDQILASAKSITAGNDVAYAQLKSALAGPVIAAAHLN